jgi:hypothetical protein
MVNPVSLALHIVNLLVILAGIAVPILICLILFKAYRSTKPRR